MPIALVGTLPVSGLNIGLVASIGGLNAEIAQLSARVGDLTGALVAQLQATASFPPNPALNTAAITGFLDPISMTAALAAMPTQGAAIIIELGLKLAPVSARVATVSVLRDSIALGVNGPKIAGWAYSGKATGFGTELELATLNGYGRTAAGTNVQAIIIATENGSSWDSFSEGFDTGGTANEPADPGVAHLLFLGERGGAEWNTGVADFLARFDLLLGELEGSESALQAAILAAAGLNLPSPTVLVNAGLDIVADIGITGLLDNLVNIQTDLAAGISGLNTQIGLVTSLIGSISAQLAAGGLTLWTYSGPAGGLGAALRGEIAAGLPGGSGPNAPLYGVALAGSPAAMTAFGSIFKTS